MKGKNKGYLIAGIILASILLIAFLGFSIAHLFEGSRSQGNGPKAQMPNLVGTKFADSKFYKNSYLISSDTLSIDAQNALSGFSYLKSTNADGSLNITLKAINPEYSDQNYVVQPDQKLYFIENSMGDDSPPNGERFLGDDHGVLVDANGIVLSFN